MTISLRITGKNADGEYWLHLDGSPQKAGLNLGDPAGMIASALLMAASGHTYIRADAPELVAALVLAKRMVDEALPEFNWGGASFLDANAIQLLNEAPIAIGKALKAGAA